MTPQCSSCHDLKQPHVAIQVVDEIRKLPYFDANNGRDHIFTFTHDNGMLCCLVL